MYTMLPTLLPLPSCPPKPFLLVEFKSNARTQQAPDASPHDKLRAALVYMSTCATPPGDGDYAELERTLRESAPGLDLAALHYVRRMRRMKLTGRSGATNILLNHN